MSVRRYLRASRDSARDHNACAQTLVMRIHRARCKERKEGYYVVMADLGTYFMSICKEIMTEAERWSGTRVEVSPVLRACLRAMQDESSGWRSPPLDASQEGTSFSSAFF